MIVFDLVCADGHHQFEGWFGSSRDYDDQQSRGLLDCPVCGSLNITKAAMAPNVGKKGNQTSTSLNSPDETVEPSASKPAGGRRVVAKSHDDVMEKLVRVQEALLADSKWVGNDFAKRARDIHYGDAEKKPIHGTASFEEVTDLADEGIAALPLPLPVVPPESKN